jgi:hypothetical protein
LAHAQLLAQLAQPLTIHTTLPMRRRGIARKILSPDLCSSSINLSTQALMVDGSLCHCGHGPA